MKKGARKLILSGCMLFATAISLVSTTFAFVTLQKEANVSEFGFSIEGQEGLLISLDGTNFYQDLTNKQITDAIAAHAGVASYDDIELNGVTLAYEDATDGEVPGVLYNTYTTSLDMQDYKPKFLKDNLVPGTDPNGVEDIYWDHEYIEAASTDYIYFDVWFKVVTNGSEKGKYNLMFSDRATENNGSPFVTSGPVDVNVETELTTTLKTFAANETISVDPVDALRLAVTQPGTTPTMYVYEPTLGLGSVAVEGMVAAPTDYDAANYSEDSHYAYSHNLATDYNPYFDPAKNAMYTNYNETHPLSKFTSALTYHEGLRTRKYLEDDVLGTFDGTSGEYTTIK